MVFELTAPNYRPKVVIMVSKADHCLNDLLYRQRIGQLSMDVAAVVSNHPDLKPLADWHQIPYYHFPLDPNDKPSQERQVLQVIEESGAELVILARYMQVLSPELCRKPDGKAINIHHSLLPGFKGAKPYHQAYNKGVKLVGATAHYINNDLDEGPIIAQGVEVVDHSHYPEDLIAKGRDIEGLTLARAVGYHIERRVFLNANRTVVL
jgi:formyltetrahydrofolate deformylase